MLLKGRRPKAPEVPPKAKMASSLLAVQQQQVPQLRRQQQPPQLIIMAMRSGRSHRVPLGPGTVPISVAWEVGTEASPVEADCRERQQVVVITPESGAAGMPERQQVVWWWAIHCGTAGILKNSRPCSTHC